MGIILRQNKGSELTFAEVDGNFQSLYYSSSLSGSDLQFFFASSSVTHSIDLTNVPGFTGITIESGSTVISNGVEKLNFLGSGIASITDAGNNQVDINVQGGGGGSGTGIFQQSASSDVYFATASLLITGSTIQESPWTVTGPNITASSAGTGGGVDKYALVVSESVWHYTDNVGVPTSKAWKTDLDGSYFNNYDHNTDTAEILRFMAGLLSASAPDTAPNTRFYSSISETKANTQTTSAPNGYVPQATSNGTVTYLNSKGFATPGQTIFQGISPIYNNSSYNIKYNSVAGGSTTVSSSNDTQLFGLGNIGSIFIANGFITGSFIDNNSSTQTAISSSALTLSKTGAGVANGLTIGDIPSSDPLIPQAYQDGKFELIFQNNFYNGGVSFSTKESTGFYDLKADIAIRSGSGNYSPYKSANEQVFYTPIIDGDFSQTTTLLYNGSQSLSAQSRSLSGAPYMQQAFWKASASIDGLFNPLYASSTTFARLVENDSNTTITNGGAIPYVGSTNGGTVQTGNFVYNQAGNIVRTIGSIPEERDIVKLSASLDFNVFGTGNTNITQNSISPTRFVIDTKGRIRNGSESTFSTSNIGYFDAGAFGQNVLSGSMAYYGRAQGYDGGSLTGTSGNTVFTEQFTGEDYRIVINDKLLTGSYTSGDKPTTSTYVVGLQPALELQVKPGYLVTPGKAYGYWIPTNPAAGAYQYYARAFQRDLTTGASDVTASFGVALNNWDSTSNGVSVAFLFSGSGAQAYSNPRIFDPTETVGDALQIGITNNNFTNPFSDPIDLYACKTGTIRGSGASTSYEFPLLNGNGMTLDQFTQDFIVIIRYKGDPTPVDDISITIT